MEGFDKKKQAKIASLRDGVDKSPKGNVDAPIQSLVDVINQQRDFVTTSSCSGRIAIFASRDNGKTGGMWCLSSHALVSADQVRFALQECPSEYATVLFKHEPLIFHVLCRNMQAANSLLKAGLGVGMRESGIVPGRSKENPRMEGEHKTKAKNASRAGTAIVALRTNATAMEAPLVVSGQRVASDEYLTALVAVANDRFEDNRLLTVRLEKALAALFAGSEPRKLPTSALGNPQHSPLRRWGHSAVVAGGAAGTSKGMSRLSDLLLLTASSGAWQAVLPAGAGAAWPPARLSHVAVYVSSALGGFMLLFGGRASPLAPLGDL
ncbi:unnamed protein product [Phaeothamnion confervicola]